MEPEILNDTILFTSESVGEGHPDKMCDQISDAILDAHLRQDPYAKVSCETMAKSDRIVVCGEIESHAQVNYEQIVRETVKRIGYADLSGGLDYKTCHVEIYVTGQSPQLKEGVYLNRKDNEIGSGYQGTVFGYATDETEECMPLTIVLAHKLIQRYADLRRNGGFWWARPDSKSQVTCEYYVSRGACIPLRVHTVVMSVQHSDKIELEELRTVLKNEVIQKVIPRKYLDNKTVYHINSCGLFTLGGPQADAGLTGRKIMVDTYGGWGALGGGAFSGKDFRKVDRSGAYAARWVAKIFVKAGLCSRCLVQLSYAIGVAEPLAITIFDYGTSRKSNKELLQILKRNFDPTPGNICNELKLRNPVYERTSVYGHFGREEFPWEKN